MITLIVITDSEYKDYANEIAEKRDDVVIISKPPAWQPFWDFIKEHSAEVGADCVLTIGKSNFEERTYELRFPEDLTHKEIVWF